MTLGFICKHLLRRNDISRREQTWQVFGQTRSGRRAALLAQVTPPRVALAQVKAALRRFAAAW